MSETVDLTPLMPLLVAIQEYVDAEYAWRSGIGLPDEDLLRLDHAASEAFSNMNKAIIAANGGKPLVLPPKKLDTITIHIELSEKKNMNKVEKGFYVHYKGGIYFVQGIAANGDTHDWNDQLVIYETMDCSGAPNAVTGEGLMRFRTVDGFTKMIDPATGADSSAENAIPRFQHIVGWDKGRPIVLDSNKKWTVFVSQVKEK